MADLLEAAIRSERLTTKTFDKLLCEILFYNESDTGIEAYPLQILEEDGEVNTIVAVFKCSKEISDRLIHIQNKAMKKKKKRAEKEDITAAEERLDVDVDVDGTNQDSMVQNSNETNPEDDGLGGVSSAVNQQGTEGNEDLTDLRHNKGNDNEYSNDLIKENDTEIADSNELRQNGDKEIGEHDYENEDNKQEVGDEDNKQEVGDEDKKHDVQDEDKKHDVQDEDKKQEVQDEDFESSEIRANTDNNVDDEGNLNRYGSEEDIDRYGSSYQKDDVDDVEDDDVVVGYDDFNEEERRNYINESKTFLGRKCRRRRFKRLQSEDVEDLDMWQLLQKIREKTNKIRNRQEVIRTRYYK